MNQYPQLILDGAGCFTLNNEVLRHNNTPICVDDEDQYNAGRLKLALLQAREEGKLPKECTLAQFNDGALFQFDAAKMLMNPATGSVDTEENWLSDMKEWETIDGKTPWEQFNSLVEVVQDKDGNWIEVE